MKSTIRIDELFQIKYGQKEYHKKSGLEHSKNGIPLISSKGLDYGVHGFYEIKPMYENIITVASTGSVCSSFYHPYKCCVDDNCLVLIPKINLSEKVMFYYSYLISLEKYKYLYGRQVTPKKLGCTLILDILEIEKLILTIPKIKQVEKDKLIEESIDINSINLKPFVIKELFNVFSGGDKPKSDDLVKINYVNSIENLTTNNGINGVISYNGRNIFSNFISVVSIGEGGTSFYQTSKSAIFTRVKALVPKKNTNLNRYTAMFLVGLLNKERYKYSYGRVVSLEKLKETIIQLPSDTNGNPDWLFMENYIKSLPYSSSI